MSKALAVHHGPFGRAVLYRLDRDMATHAHREGHLIFLVQGEPAIVRVDGAPCPLSALEGVAVDPWRPHSFHASDPLRGSLFLVLYVDQAWFGRMGGAGALRFPGARVRRTPLIDALVGRASSRLLAPGDAATMERDLFDLTMACWQGAPAGPASPAPRDFRVRRAVRALEARLVEGGPVDMVSVARGAGLSRSHFFQLFREHLGMTPNLYLNMLRMETAIARLTATDAAVTEIGLDLGFSSQAAFTRFFASNVGIPPSDYRRVALMAA